MFVGFGIENTVVELFVKPVPYESEDVIPIKTYQMHYFAKEIYFKWVQFLTSNFTKIKKLIFLK